MGDVGNTLGLQCSVNSVNSPAKAWRQIFTAALLDKIVAHKNDYGEVYCKEWIDIDRQDLVDFISILFISKWLCPWILLDLLFGYITQRTIQI